MAKKARAKKSKAAKSRSGPAFVLQLLWKTAVGLLVLAGLAAGGWFGVRTAWGALAERPEFQIAGFDLDDCPPWVRGAAMGRQLREALRGEPCGRSVLDPEVAELVAARLGASPWVLRVDAVRRRMPDRLHIALTFRKPAGIVWLNAKRYMVDRDGHWLPDDLFQQPAEWADVQLPVIEDRRFSQHPCWNAPWNGPRFAVGARLTDFFLHNGLLERLHVSTIDVAGVGRGASQPDIVLIVPWTRDDGTPAETRVLWGQSTQYQGLDGVEAPLLATSDQEKLHKLLAQVAVRPGLRHLAHVDLQYRGQAAFLPAE
ncbi:MAG: hypothetical protein GXY85_01325 [Candidatus Brocadiaceae bacterium]|nr:hypothetical protein [Candidatus Brocadiaceae bacterium]